MGRRVNRGADLIRKNGRNPLGYRPRELCYFCFVKAINRSYAPS